MTGSDAIAHAIAGGAGAPLTAEGRQTLARLARRAWEAAGRPGFADQDPDLPDCLRMSQAEAFDFWRHTQVKLSCGAEGLRACAQADFRLVRARFLRVLGHDWAADRDQAAALTDNTRRALWALERECDRARGVLGNPEAYAAAIARSKFRQADVEALAPNQLWQLVFHIRAAVQRRRRPVAAVSDRRLRRSEIAATENRGGLGVQERNEEDGRAVPPETR